MLSPNAQPLSRTLLADTGAGSKNGSLDLILDEDDCLLCGGTPWQPTNLTGAYAGTFPIYLVRVQVPSLSFDDTLRVVAVPTPVRGFDGLAGFRFLNRYGNFGDQDAFGLE